jgi:hypothetical protein
LVPVPAVELADASLFVVVSLEDVEGGVTFTEVEDDELLSGVVAGGVVALGVTTVVSREAVGPGVVVEVVVVRSHAASDTPRVRAATRGISFMCSPDGSVRGHMLRFTQPAMSFIRGAESRTESGRDDTRAGARLQRRDRIRPP